MLKYEDYKAYQVKAINLLINTNRNALQIARYYLGKWGKFERNIGSLNLHEQKIATELFTVLKKLNADERRFLADKYRVVIHGRNSRTDKEIANEYGINVKEYTEIRKAVLYKFFCILTKEFNKSY